MFWMGVSTISVIVYDACLTLCNCLREETKWEDITSEFYYRPNFPNVLGAVNGNLVEIINPLR